MNFFGALLDTSASKIFTHQHTQAQLEQYLQITQTVCYTIFFVFQMGCNQSSVQDPDADLTPEEEARIKELTGDDGEDDDDEPVGRGFGNIGRRDSIRINKDAIAKRKQHKLDIADGTAEAKTLPRAFMKNDGKKNKPVIAKSKKGGERGFGKGRRDSIRVNKDMMERKKNRNNSNSAAPAGVNVEVIE